MYDTCKTNINKYKINVRHIKFLRQSIGKYKYISKLHLCNNPIMRNYVFMRVLQCVFMFRLLIALCSTTRKYLFLISYLEIIKIPLL